MNKQVIESKSCEILRAITATHIQAVRSLMEEYATDIGLDLCFQNFADELAALPGDYAAPHGCLLLARSEDQWAGCVALRPLPDVTGDTGTSGCCEMKRLFVPARFRGRGLGRMLAQAIISQARAIGCKQMKLDTVEALTAANRLYRSLGFEPIAPYCHNPFADARFFGLSLS